MPRSTPDLLRAAAIAVLLVATAAGRAEAQPAEAVRLYEEGSQRLLAGNYSGAVGSYRAAMDLGVGSAALYYNLGVAYYRLDRLGESIRFLERARRLAPSDRRILHNLEIARSRIPERFARLPVRFWTRGWQRVVSTLGVGGLFAIGLVLWWLPFGLVAWRVRRGRRTPWTGRLGWPSAALAVAFLAFATAASVRSPFGDQAVIIEPTAPLYTSAAGDDAGIVLHEGLTVDVEARDGMWLRVRLPNGVTGWVQAEAAAEV
jgi:tetratricopeptide (TPR) repeat protein